MAAPARQWAPPDEAAGVSREFPGVAESAGWARRFIRGVLGAGHPAGDTAELCATELLANALAYTASGLPGGTVTVTVQLAERGVLVQVRDGGALHGCCPRLAQPCELPEHGQGLRLVDALADDWGAYGRTVWFLAGSGSDGR